jgi:DNA-binding NtrC family response regulator
MHADPALVVAGRAMTELISMAERAAQSPAKVLITGESGVGKDLVARFIHSKSTRQLTEWLGRHGPRLNTRCAS